MLISDLSSDVCSSDLLHERCDLDTGDPRLAGVGNRRRRLCRRRHVTVLQLLVGEIVVERGDVEAARDHAAIRRLQADFIAVDVLRLERVDARIGSEDDVRSEEHTSELQSLMRISYAVFCLKKKTNTKKHTTQHGITKKRKTTQQQV